MENTDKNKEKELNKNLNKFLNNNNNCEDEECLIKDNDELVQREHKKIITNDGRQLLSEYTR
tara:strand:- start:1826 stop:2011 length:186 start_codon:yes stop_codon:yes gene_type:complete